MNTDYLQQMYGNPIIYPTKGDIFRAIVEGSFITEPKVHYEGGVTTQATKYAIKAYDGLRGYAADAEPEGFGYSLEQAHLFDTADAAAKVIAEFAGYRELGIVAVTVSTTSEKVKVVTTETPAKTVYHVLNTDGKPVRASERGGFWWTGITAPTDFESANAAAAAIERRESKYSPTKEWTIKPVKTLRDVKVEKTVVAKAHSGRSL